MAAGAHAVRTIEQSAADSIKEKKTKTKQNEQTQNLTPDKKGKMASANKKYREDTRPGYFWLINYGERISTTTLALGYSLLDPSRSGILLHAVVQPWVFFLCSDRLRHETSRPLFRRLATFPFTLGCSRPLIRVDPESSEVVQETPHVLTLFRAPLCSPQCEKSSPSPQDRKTPSLVQLTIHIFMVTT